MAAKQRARMVARATIKSAAARQKVIDRSAREVQKAHRNLELKLKKHKQVISAQFFAI